MAVTVTVHNSDGQVAQIVETAWNDIHNAIQGCKAQAEVGKRDIPAKNPWWTDWSGTYTCPACAKSRSMSGSFTA